MDITRIKAPKFRVGRHVLNELELRQLQLEVAKGIKPAGIVVVDIKGVRARIDEFGGLSEGLEGLSTSTDLKFELVSYNRKRG